MPPLSRIPANVPTLTDVVSSARRRPLAPPALPADSPDWVALLVGQVMHDLEPVLQQQLSLAVPQLAARLRAELEPVVRARLVAALGQLPPPAAAAHPLIQQGGKPFLDRGRNPGGI